MLFRSGTKVSETKRNDLSKRFVQLQTWGAKMLYIESALQGDTQIPLGKTVDQQLRDLLDKKPQALENYNYMKKNVKETLKNYAERGEQTATHHGPLDAMGSLWQATLADMDIASDQDGENSTIKANMELFNEVYENEFNKLKQQIKEAEIEDLFALRHIARSSVDDLLS